MADEPESEDAASGPQGAAVWAALGAANRSQADAFLGRQIALTDIQIAQLGQQEHFEHSHLRWRRFNDWIKGGLQILTLIAGVALVIGLGAAVWNASQAEGLVVDSFSVPPSLEAAGVRGDVVADDMTIRIAAVRDFANENSLARSKDVRQDRDRDIKVEIPQTGVSLAEAWRYLRNWLGNEQHLRGSVRSRPDGQIALAVALGGANSFTFTGAAADLDKLEQQAAERVFATIDPVNIVLYLLAKGRGAESLEAARHLVSLGGDKRTLSESYSLYANMIRYLEGDIRRSFVLAKMAIAMDPAPAPQHMELLNSARMLGHDEAVLEQARIIPTLRQEDNIGSWRTSDGVPYVWQLGAFYRAVETGDFADAQAQPCLYQCSPGEAALRRADVLARLHDPGKAAVLVAEAGAALGADDIDLAQSSYDIHAEQGQWEAAASDARAIAHGWMTRGLYARRFGLFMVQTTVMPQLAYALARAGDFAAAHAASDGGSPDCYNCLRAHGRIDALQHNWVGAAFWFAKAQSQAPSIPFAYADWGAMLLAKGDGAGAAAKFQQANHKGPHFADALEGWGEALMAQNHSDQALAKFARAAQYAPQWKRLHQQWALALRYAGRAAEAQAQSRIAAHLL